MTIWDELRYLRDLFVKKARCLLHLLSTSTHKVCADIIKLLKQYYNLLFADAPATVHQAMVDFNQWLEMLKDTRSEGIECGPSLSENPWLALEEPQPQDGPIDEAFTADNPSTVQLLRTACEYYMIRCDNLRQTNAGLTTQLEELKTQLKEALAHAFESQQALEREREVSTLQARRLVLGIQIGDQLSQQNSLGQRPIELHQQITDAFQMLNVVSAVQHGGTETVRASEMTSVSDWGLDDNKVAVEDDQSTDCTEEIKAAQEGRHHLSPSEDEEVVLGGQEALYPYQTQSASESTPYPVAVAESTTKGDGCDYQQLTQLRVGEEKSGGWYRQALRSLKEKREQRRLVRRSRVATPFMVHSTMGGACKEVSSFDDQEFVQLVSIRDTAEDSEDSTWYRRALQHLKEDRRRRVSLRDRDSFSSTISLVD